MQSPFEFHRHMPSHFRKIVAVSWMLSILVIAPIAYGSGNTVARVTDLQGSATEIVNGIKRNLRILARVQDGTVIELRDGAVITLHFSAKRRDMRFIGPGTVTVKGQTAEASNGIASTKEHKDIGVSLDLSGSGLGGIIARGLNLPKPKVLLQHPIKTRVIPDRPLRFSWSSGGPSAVYTLSMHINGGRSLFRIRTTKTEATLPQNIRLEPGIQYRWDITTDFGNGETTQSSGGFKTANQSEIEQYYSINALQGGTVSDLVLYALSLDQLKLKMESDAVWQQLETLRPGISASR